MDQSDYKNEKSFEWISSLFNAGFLM